MSKKSLLLLGVFGYATLLFLSVLYYKERILFNDGAFYLFHLVQDQQAVIQNSRFIAFIPELPVLIALKLGASLSTLAMCYSVSICAFSATVFFILLLVFDNKPLAIATLLFNTLMVSHTFYWILSELSQAVPLLLLYLAILDKKIQENNTSEWLKVLASVLLLFIVFAHPLVLFAAVYAYSFLFLRHPTNRTFIAAQAVQFLVLFAIKYLFFTSGYDKQAMNGLSKIFQLLPQFFSLNVTKKFIGYIISDYYVVILALALMVTQYILRKSWLNAALLLSFFIGYIFVIHINYPAGGEQFYMENQYMLLAFFVIIPLCYDSLPILMQRWNENRVSIALLLLLCFSIFRIYSRHELYENCLNWKRTLLKRTAAQPDQKLIIPLAKQPMDTLIMSWGVAYECCLLSSMESEHSRSILTESSSGQFNWILPNRRTFYTPFENFPYEKLNAKYFSFRDTSTYTTY